MWRRTTRILIECCFGAAALALLVVGIAVWRLSKEPLNVDFLSPYLEDSLGANRAGFDVEIGETVLVWADWSRTLDLRARQVRVRDATGSSMALLPDVSVTLSLPALVQGIVAPTAIEIIGARVILVRNEEGQFEFETGEESEPVAESDLSLVVPEILDELSSKPTPGHPLSFLKSFRIAQGRLTIFDRKLLIVWRAPRADINLYRNPAGLSGDMRLSVQLGDEATDVDGAFLFEKARGAIDLAAYVTDLRVKSLAQLHERFAPLSGVDLSVDASVAGFLGTDGTFRFLDFELDSGPGALAVSEYLPDPRPVTGLELRGNFDGQSQILELEKAAVQFATGAGTEAGGGPKLELGGTAALRDGDVQVDLTTRLSNLPTSDLALYWSPAVAPNPRDWVLGNVRKGVLEEANLQASLRVPAGDPQAAEITGLSGDYRYRDLEIHYRRPLPPVNGVTGTATFDLSRMTLRPEAGLLRDIDVKQADIEITGLDGFGQDIRLDLSVVGPLRTSLQLLDHDSLKLISGLGIDPKDVAGEAAARLKFAFPLLKSLTFEQVELSAEADIRQVAVKQAALGQDVEDGHVRLELDKSGMNVTGPVTFGGVPIDLRWRENFTGEHLPTRVFEVEAARLEARDFGAFGLDMSPYLDGHAAGSMLVTLFPNDAGSIEAKLDLAPAELTIAPIYWRKAPGVPGRISLALTLAEDRLATLDRVAMAAGTLRARGRGRFDDAGRDLAWVEFDELEFDDSSLSHVTIEQIPNGLSVSLGTGVVDASPLIDSLTDGTDDVEEEEEEPQPDLRVSAAHLDWVILGPGRGLENVSLEFERDARGWQVASLRAEVPEIFWDADESNDQSDDDDADGEGTPASEERPRENGARNAAAGAAVEAKVFMLDYRLKDGRYRFEAEADDAGALLRVLDVRDSMIGGHLEMEGRSDGPFPGSPMDARIEIQDYVLVEAPILTRMLTAASFTGLLDLLSGKGIRFNRLVSEFTLADGVARTDLLRAYGPGLGITARGSIDFDKSMLDLEGTIAPAYAVSQLLGQIPGLDWVLTGPDGEGVIAVTYSMKGPLEDPEVSANPLALLAPGFLRGLFGAIGGGDGDEPRVFPDGPTR